LFNFRIVFCLDLLVVEKVLLLAFMLYELKAVAVKGVFILISSNVVDNDTVGSVRALRRVWFTDALVLE
jgi:hypothetical protein